MNGTGPSGSVLLRPRHRQPVARSTTARSREHTSRVRRARAWRAGCVTVGETFDDPDGRIGPTAGISRGIRMEDLGRPVRPACATEKDLRRSGRRGLEDRERQDAIFRAEQAGRIAADVGSDRPAPSGEDVARFRAQLRRIEECVSAMPHMVTLLKSEGTQRSESRLFASSLHKAERAELRLGEPPGRATS